MTTNQTNKRPCKAISLQEKLGILKQLEAGSSRREIEENFKCSQSTISRVLLSKDSILQEAQNNTSSKREGTTPYKELYHALSKWAKEMNKSDNVITAHIAKEKAVELSRNMGQELKPSKAWLYRWKERENIIFGKRFKDPEEILKEFLDKRKKSQDVQRIDEDNNNKRLKIDNHENRTSFPVAESLKKERLNSSSNSPDKPRLKREYIKRLPIIDASGIICRSRKEKTFLTLLQKLEILQRLKNGERRPDLIIEYKLSQSAMSQIVADEKKILKLAAGGQNLQMKRVRGGIFKDGEAELNAWVQEKMQIGENLTRTQIKNRAKEIADRLHIDFKASTGWLEKWKSRMNLDFNENQILQRKIPTYLTNEDDSINGPEQCDQMDIIYDHSENNDVSDNDIKQEYEENECNEDVETNDEISYGEINDADVKPELLTPQQFYLQTIQADTQASQQQQQEQQDRERLLQPAEEIEEESDIKPFVGTPPHVINTAPPEETLHEQVLSWFNRYNISPVAATDLLNILQPHLHTVVKPTKATVLPMRRKRHYF